MNHNNHSHSPGIYIHIPFCLRKCRYCDFYSIASPDEGMAPFINALGIEMSLVDAPSTPADTLYLGGGTPSLMEPGRLETILEQAGRYFSLTPSAEITVEVNPGTISANRLRAYAALGCNRLNIGIQSFDDRQLSFLGRIHDARQARQIFRQARSAGFANIGIDLIYGLPGQTAAAWRQDLQSALELQPEHISCYMLSYEDGTPLYADLQTGNITALSEQRCADLFRSAHNILMENGYEHYEISNFAATPHQRSRHNQKYWNHVPYIGLGPSAHGFDLIRRSWNHADLVRYVDLLKQNRLPRCDQELLTREQQLMEAVYLGLRQADGLDPVVFQQRFNVEFAAYFREILEKMKGLGWLYADCGRYRPSMEGMLFADRMAEEFIDAIDPIPH